MTTRVYTPAEKRRRARLLISGAYRSAGDVSSNERAIDRIDRAAEDRGRREAAAYERRLNQAKDDLATARVAERCASRDDKAAAKDKRKDAEKQLRLVERGRR